eukprot:SAG31_NODE_6973_length_1830_cov_1.006355_2_plen_222_part_00
MRRTVVCPSLMAASCAAMSCHYLVLNLLLQPCVVADVAPPSPVYVRPQKDMPATLKLYPDASSTRATPGTVPSPSGLLGLKTDDLTASPVPNCTSFCKYFLICTCGDVDTGALPPTSECTACVEAHEATFSSPLSHAIPCSVQRALEICGATRVPSRHRRHHHQAHLCTRRSTCRRHVHGSDNHSGASPAQRPAENTGWLLDFRQWRKAMPRSCSLTAPFT